MGLYLTMGSMLKCSMGTTPSKMIVLPINKVLHGSNPMANIMDHKPMLNIMPFGLCRSLANPVVASATAAASGVLTPMPCIPNTPAPWIPGIPTLLIGKMPAVDDSCKLMCMWAGVISVMKGNG